VRVLVVGKAKTGTTALVSLVRQALEPCALVMEPRSVLDFGHASVANTGNEAIKVLYEHYRGRFRHLDALVHGEFGFPVDRVVFISRDVRDEMVSKLLYHAKIARDDGLVPEPRRDTMHRWVDALRAKEADPQGVSFRELCRTFESLFGIDLWSRIADMAEKRAYETYARDGVVRDHFVLRYEDMVEGRTAGLADHLGVPLVDDMEQVDLGRFGHTRRSGASGNWRSWFTEVDVEILRPLITQMLGDDDRYDDWALTGGPPLDALTGSGYVARIAEIPGS
jgi:hypothetical protein